MGQATILLVEDNADDEALTLRALKRNNIKNEIAVARDGVEALLSLGRLAPGRSERDAATHPARPEAAENRWSRSPAQNKGRAGTKLLPVVILTSSNEEQDRIRGYGLGANSYIRKPVTFPSLPRLFVS